MQAIREGLTKQQTMLNEILGLLQPASAAARPEPRRRRPGSAATNRRDAAENRRRMPPVARRVLQHARSDYYYATQFELAIDALTAAIKKFPDSPEAARAQMLIGESYYKSGKYKEALDGVHGHAHQLQGPGRAARRDVPSRAWLHERWAR